MTPNFYWYKAYAVRIVDGDTLVATVDRGFYDYSEKYIRLHGINAPELNSPDVEVREAGKAAKEYLQQILPIGSEFWVNSKKLDPYKRPIAEIFLPNQTISINDQMIQAGHAVKY